jgi:hypothetical protein
MRSSIYQPSHRIIFGYNISYTEPYLSDIDSNEWKHQPEPFYLTPEEINIILNQFNEKLRFLLHDYSIHINQDEKVVIIITNDDLTEQKIDDIYTTLTHNIEPFRRIFEPVDFDFEYYIDSFEIPHIEYTEADLEPRKYYFMVNYIYDDFNDDIKEPEE